MRQKYLACYGVRGDKTSTAHDGVLYDSVEDASNAIKAEGYVRFRIGGESLPIFVTRGSGFPLRGHRIAWVQENES